MDLREIELALAVWGQSRWFVRRLSIYGSRLKGTHRPDSDLDVAIEFDPYPNDGDHLTTWVCERQAWQAELRQLIPLDVHLERLDPNGRTPHIEAGLAECSKVVYERAV